MQKFDQKEGTEYAVVDNEDEGPLLGNDIQICDCPKTNPDSSSSFGDDYQLPDGLEQGSDEAKSYLAGDEYF